MSLISLFSSSKSSDSSEETSQDRDTKPNIIIDPFVKNALNTIHITYINLYVEGKYQFVWYARIETKLGKSSGEVRTEYHTEFRDCINEIERVLQSLK